MKFALNLPNFGNFSDIDALVDLAVAAEAAGWDGIFLWDHILADDGVPFVDPWIAMAAIACATRRIRIETMVTPIGKEQDLLPDDIRAMRAYIDAHRKTGEPYDIAVNGRVFATEFTEEPVSAPDHEPASVTWWIEVYRGNVPLARVRENIRHGPPA